MAVLLLCIAFLIVGYFTYGMLVERIFKPDATRPTLCSTMADGVDYASMPT